MKENIEKGKFLKSLREAHNLTQDELAKEVGVSQSDILVWETGIKFPDDDTLNKIAKVLNVTIDELKKGDFIENSSDNENNSSETKNTEKSEKLKVTDAHGKYKKNDRAALDRKENMLIVVLAILIAVIAIIMAFSGKTATNKSYKYLYFDSDSFINNQSYIKIEDNIYSLYLYEIDTSSDKEISNINLYYGDKTIIDGYNKDYIIDEDYESENIKNMLDNDTFIKVSYSDGSSEVSKITFSSDYNYSITDSSKIINPNKTTNKQKIIYNKNSKSSTDYGVVPSKLLNYGFSYTSNKYVKSTNGIRVEYYDGVIHLYVRGKNKSTYVERTVGSSKYKYVHTEGDKTATITANDGTQSRDCEKEECNLIKHYVAYTKYISDLLVNDR